MLFIGQKVEAADSPYSMAARHAAYVLGRMLDSATEQTKGRYSIVVIARRMGCGTSKAQRAVNELTDNPDPNWVLFLKKRRKNDVNMYQLVRHMTPEFAAKRAERQQQYRTRRAQERLHADIQKLRRGWDRPGLRRAAAAVAAGNPAQLARSMDERKRIQLVSAREGRCGHCKAILEIRGDLVLDFVTQQPHVCPA